MGNSMNVSDILKIRCCCNQHKPAGVLEVCGGKWLGMLPKGKSLRNTMQVGADA
jgi:hypothetical protein